MKSSIASMSGAFSAGAQRLIGRRSHGAYLLLIWLLIASLSSKLCSGQLNGWHQSSAAATDKYQTAALGERQPFKPARNHQDQLLGAASAATAASSRLAASASNQLESVAATRQVGAPGTTRSQQNLVMNGPDGGRNQRVASLAALASSREDQLFAARQPPAVEVDLRERADQETNLPDQRDDQAAAPADSEPAEQDQAAGEGSSASVVESSSAAGESGDEAVSDSSSTSPGQVDGALDGQLAGEDEQQQQEATTHSHPQAPDIAHAGQELPLESAHFRPSRESPGYNQPAQGDIAPPARRSPPLVMTQLELDTTPAPRNAANNRPQQQQQVATTTAAATPRQTTTPTSTLQIATRRPQQPSFRDGTLATSPSSFEVNMGTDQMMIKPAPDLLPIRRGQPPQQTPPSLVVSSRLDGEQGVPAAFQQRHNQQLIRQQLSKATTFANSPSNLAFNGHELATESVNHQHVAMMSDHQGHQQASQTSGEPTTQATNLNERRHLQELLVPQMSTNNGRQFMPGGPAPQTQGSFHEAPLSSLPIGGAATVCFTPLSLTLTIALTMLITVALTYCAQQLIKYLKRHQFDLVANSKHFGHGNGSRISSPSRAHQPGGQLGARRPTGRDSTHLAQYGNTKARPFDEQRGAPGGCLLHLLQRQDDCQKCLANPQLGGAFRNPYFSEPAALGQTQAAASSIQIQPDALGGWSGASGQQQQQLQAAGLLRTAELGDSADEQMHFIESHIANLHNRQVTSSVKELSSLGHTQPPTSSTGVGNLTCSNSRASSSSLVCPTIAALQTQVVDLTSREHRERVLQNPREGDLIAVDLSGHDIIGLGFDICGNPRDGILVKAVHSRGPARESGAIAPGDRIKCLNVSFDCVTHQDASDILNCAAPYKMRLLLEKRVLGERELARLATGSQRSSNLRSPHPQDQHRSSPLDTTRQYLKRLTSKLTSGGVPDEPDEGSVEGNLHSVLSGAAPGNKAMSPPLGSAAARQLQHSRRALRSAAAHEMNATEAPREPTSHVNEAFSEGDFSEGVDSRQPTNGPKHSSITSSSSERKRRKRQQRRSQSTPGLEGSDISDYDHHQQAKRLHKLHGPQAMSSKMISVDLSQLSDDDDDQDDCLNANSDYGKHEMEGDRLATEQLGKHTATTSHENSPVDSRQASNALLLRERRRGDENSSGATPSDRAPG